MKTKSKITIAILFIVTLIAIAIAIFFPFNSKLRNLDFYIFDDNDNYHYEVGEKLEFYLNDTTALRNRSLVWHFGNGDTIMRNKNVAYSYKTPGRYLVTLNVGKKHTISKYIKVISLKEKSAIDSIPKISGVKEAYVGEELIFSADGYGVDTWYWEFGETGTVDAYNEQVSYTYTNPGHYTVKLKTNTLKYPVYHDIVIYPRFEKIEAMSAGDPLVLAQDDIKKRLQAIADASVQNKKAFYTNLNYIKNKYICNNIKDIIVSVNKSKYNDFYSYCQGLHYLEGGNKHSVVIEEVKLDTAKCFTKMEIVQSTILK